MSEWQLASTAGRQRTTPPPLHVWVRAGLLAIVMLYAACGYYIYYGNILPTQFEKSFFTQQFEEFNQKLSAVRSTGEDPVTVVFIGTSRMKNVSFSPETIARVAQAASIKRPVVSTRLTIALGGYERLRDAVLRLAATRPDHVVIMPELLYQDFTITGRGMIAFRYLQERLRGRDFVMFDTQREFMQAACYGFEASAKAQLDNVDTWMNANPADPGPMAAAAAIRQMAESGSNVYIANIPPHPDLAKLKAPRPDTQKLLAAHGLEGMANIHPMQGSTAVEPGAYCDYNHINPEKAAVWLSPLFQKMAAGNE